MPLVVADGASELEAALDVLGAAAACVGLGVASADRIAAGVAAAVDGSGCGVAAGVDARGAGAVVAGAGALVAGAGGGVGGGGGGVGAGGGGVGLGVAGGGVGAGAVTTSVGPARLGLGPWLAWAWKLTGHRPAGSVLVPRKVPAHALPPVSRRVTDRPATIATTLLAAKSFSDR